MTDETIGELHDRLPEDQWVDLPQFGVRVKRWPEPVATGESSARAEVPAEEASTSAQLRQTQAALAASQADLTRVERELHDALRRAADLEQVREELAQRKLRNEGDFADIQDLTRERDDARAECLGLKQDVTRWEQAYGELQRTLRERVRELQKLLADRDFWHKRAALHLAEVSTANRELDMYRHRLEQAAEHRVDVARADLTAPCGDCGGPIQRGHAVERIPTTDLLRHVACPDANPDQETP